MSIQTYEELVLEQIRHFSHGQPDDYNPVAFPITVPEESVERPLWELEFTQKPIMPQVHNFIDFEINYEPTLVRLHIPRQFAGIEIEREVIPLDPLGDEALIERVYLRYSLAIGSGRIFAAANSVTYSYSQIYQLRLFSMVAWEPTICHEHHIRCEFHQPRQLLMRSLPIALPKNFGDLE